MPAASQATTPPRRKQGQAKSKPRRQMNPLIGYVRDRTIRREISKALERDFSSVSKGIVTLGLCYARSPAFRSALRQALVVTMPAEPTHPLVNASI